MAFFDLTLDELKTYRPTPKNPKISTHSGNPHWMKRVHIRSMRNSSAWIMVSPRRKLSMSHSTALADNLSGAGSFSCRGEVLRPCLASLNSSATAADAVSRLTGWNGPPRAMPIS